ncbi:hypothetical protein ACFL13_00030 [Patescibacteria group bacterium]
MEKTQIDQLREYMQYLMKEREKAQMKKGLAAEHNKDLRENADYEYWLQREQNLTVRIRKISKQIEEKYKKGSDPYLNF